MFRNSNQYLLGKNSEFGLLILEVSGLIGWSHQAARQNIFMLLKGNVFTLAPFPAGVLLLPTCVLILLLPGNWTIHQTY